MIFMTFFPDKGNIGYSVGVDKCSFFLTFRLFVFFSYLFPFFLSLLFKFFFCLLFFSFFYLSLFFLIFLSFLFIFSFSLKGLSIVVKIFFLKFARKMKIWQKKHEKQRKSSFLLLFKTDLPYT